MSEQPEVTGLPVPGQMAEFLGRTWWIYLIGGIAAVVFGILALANPRVALFVLGLYFAAFLLVDGVLSFFGAVRHSERKGWWLLMLYGVLATLVGAYLILNPPASMLVFVYTVAFFTLCAGFTQLLFGFHVRREIQGEWVLYLSGALSVLLGLLILLKVGVGSLLVVYMIAGWALFLGIIRILFAFKVKRFAGGAAP
jgi:uncharacterized membrane protein HdeD (DUF308 family)